MKKTALILIMAVSMLLTTLPVFAADKDPGTDSATPSTTLPNAPGDQVKVIEPDICHPQVQVDMGKPVFQSCLKSTCIPIFLAERNLCRACTFKKSDLLFNGKIADWFNYYENFSYPTMAEAYWKQSKYNVANGGEYRMDYPFISNIAKITVKIDGIKYVTTKGTSDDIIKYENAKKATAAADKAYQAQKEIVAGMKKTDDGYYTQLKKLDELEAALTAAQEKEAAAKVLAEKEYTTKSVKTIEAPGLLLMVEPAYRNVFIKHVFDINGKETIYTEKLQIPSDKILTKDDAKNFAKVSQMMDGKDYKVVFEPKLTKFIDAKQFDPSIQDYVYRDYGYELHYVAATAANQDKNANNDKNVAPSTPVKVNPNVAGATHSKSLPATGVANTLPMVSAALLVLIGLAITKRH